MKSFFEEYGFVILAAIIVILLIVMATPVGDLIKIQIDNTINSFGSKTQSKLNATDGIINVRASTANNKITLEWDAVKKEDKFKYQYKASNTKGEANWTNKADVTANEKSRTVTIENDSNNQPLANKTKVEYKIYDSNDVLVASGIVIAKINGNTVDNDVNEGISKTDSFVGYYADVDGNGTVDGVIFADLGHSNSGQWGASGTYSYSAIPADELKSYEISQDNYSGKFGDKPVLKATSSSGKDRFYVMALENIGSNKYTWYANAFVVNGDGKMTDYASTTSKNFGTGKQNTINMIEKWNNKAYGNQTANDLWNAIQEQVANGWFVPSLKEWAAFGRNLGVTKDNYSSLGLSSYCWSSSQNNRSIAHSANFYYGGTGGGGVNVFFHVRLATTF